MTAHERIADEYEQVCEYMARNGCTGKPGDHLPDLLSVEVSEAIHADLYAFQQRIREHAYALAMERAAQKGQATP